MTDFIGGVTLPPYWISTTSQPSNTQSVMNAAGEGVAFIFTVPKTGTLNSCEFRIGVVTNVPDNGLKISFQNIDANGDPDGVVDQFRNIASGVVVSNAWINPGLITSDGTDGGVKRSVTVGDRLALVIEFVTFVAGDVLGISTASAGSQAQRIEGNLFYSSFLSGGSWVKDGLACPLMALEYETDGYIPVNDFSPPATTWNTRSYGNGSTPDEIALRFQVPWDCECDGAWVRMDIDGDAEVRLYSGTTVLKSAVLDSSSRLAALGANVYVRWAPEALTANTTYRLSVIPTTATALILYTFTANSAGLMAAAPGGVEWYRSERTDAGAWSDTTTERPLIGLHLSGIEAGSGSSASSAAYIG